MDQESASGKPKPSGLVACAGRGVMHPPGCIGRSRTGSGGTRFVGVALKPRPAGRGISRSRAGGASGASSVAAAKRRVGRSPGILHRARFGCITRSTGVVAASLPVTPGDHYCGKRPKEPWSPFHRIHPGELTGTAHTLG
jgi:hypothetical protein